tara:strand:+ start:633 stop:938 length:306 start_codon:yes stop_codon:yes gene_type:complete
MVRDVRLVENAEPFIVKVSSSADMEPIESSVNGTATVTFSRESRNIILTNDSATLNLQYKFDDAADFATLKPTETVTMDFASSQILFSTGGAVSYRLWVYG